MSRLTKKVAEIFGYDRSQVWWYRDLALTIIAWFSTAFALGGLTSGESWDLRFGIACLVLALICCFISPNRTLIFGTVAGITALRGWLAVLRTADLRAWLLAVPATLVCLGVLIIYKDRPIRK
jgi:hypothetical protein